MSETLSELLNSLNAAGKKKQVMESRATEIEGDKIISLDLTFCGISKIPDGTFSSLKDLKKLYLGYNDLSDITAATFKGLDGLTLLSLFNCGLESLPDNIFASLANLDWLDLRENDLAKIPSSVGGLKKLNYLYLQNNVKLDFGDEFDFNQDYHSKRDVTKFFEAYTKHSGGATKEATA